MAKKIFVDSLQYYSAVKHGMETLLTQNIKDYKEKDLIIQTPEQFINDITSTTTIRPPHL